MTIRLGTDPEFFSIDEKGNAISPALLKKFSGINPIGGDIKHPVFIKDNLYQWIMDGVAWELTLLKPFELAGELYDTVQIALENLENFISKLTFNDQKLSLFKKSTVKLSPKMYTPYLEDEDIHQGFIFGCDTDYDAIDTEYQSDTVDVSTHKFRYGGGHIHFSGCEFFKDYPNVGILFLIPTVGNYTVINTPFPKEDLKRVETYGRPARFRPQKYPNGDFGIEYRTPSNAWCSMKKNQVIEMMELGKWAIALFEKSIKTKDTEFLDEFLRPSCEAITTHNINLAKDILGKIK